MAAERQLYGWLGQNAPQLAHAMSIQQMRKQRLQFMRQHPDIAHDLTRVRLQTLEQLMADYGYPRSKAQQGLKVFRHARNQVALWDDVLPVLDYLRQRYRLVSITNGNVQLEHTPLQGYFHLSLSAEDVGAAKPDPALFHSVAQWSGLPYAQMLHVGDDWERDVLPAKRLGMSTAWVHRKAVSPAETGGADLCLFNLRPLRIYL